MNEDYVYIMYPVKVEKLKGLGIPFVVEDRKIEAEVIDEENFVPLWYGTASFPEDDI